MATRACTGTDTAAKRKNPPRFAWINECLILSMP